MIPRRLSVSTSPRVSSTAGERVSLRTKTRRNPSLYRDLDSLGAYIRESFLGGSQLPETL